MNICFFYYFLFTSVYLSRGIKRHTSYFAITIILTHLIDCNLTLMAKVLRTTPTLRKISYKIKTDFAFEHRLF